MLKNEPSAQNAAPLPFTCKRCGNCCSGNVEITLNLYDLYKIGRWKGFGQSEMLFTSRLVKLQPGENGIAVPQLLFRRKPLKFCPFLSNRLDAAGQLEGLCQLHPAHKPLVCTMAPLGLIIDLEKGSWSYPVTAPAEDCPAFTISSHLERETLLRQLQPELDFAYRYYLILDRLVGTPSPLLDRQLTGLFAFNLDKEFAEILQEKEKLFPAKR